MRFRPGLVVVMCAALGVAAGAQTSQPASQPAPLAELVWTFVDARTDADASRALRQLATRKDLDLATLDAILNRAPPRPEAPRGVQDELPFAIPGTDKRTTYSLSVPADAPPGEKLPLWISSHGTHGDGSEALRSILPALKNRRVMVAAPTEAKDLDGKGWGYSHRERMLHVALIDLLAAQYAVDRDRVIISGWSRGGHAAFDIACRYADRFAAAGPIIGSALERDRPLLVNLHGTRVHAINGAKDQPALFNGSVEAIRRLTALKYDATSFVDPNRGHEFFGDQLEPLAGRMLGAARRVAPAELHFAVRELDYNRHFYVRVRQLAGAAYHVGQRVVIAGVDKMNDDQKRQAHLEYVEAHTPKLDLAFAANEFRITTKLITQFDLYLPLALVDVTKPVTVIVNDVASVKNRRFAPPTPTRVLELLREFGGADPAFRFVDKVTLAPH